MQEKIIKQTVTNAIVNTVSSIVSGVTNAINNSFYVDVGGGFGQVLGNTEFGVEATKTTGFEISKQEFKPYTSTSYGAYGGILGINREIRNYDAQNNPMTMPHEIYDSPDTVKSTIVFAKDQYIEVSKNEIDDNLFVGISIDATDLSISGPYFVVKVGFNIDVSWLPGYKSY